MRTVRGTGGFTLIEVLIAVLLVGVGVSSILALILQATRVARQVSFWTISTPSAQSAAEYAVAQGLITAGNVDTAVVDLPAPGQTFQSPVQFRIDAGAAPGAAVPDATHPQGTLRILRVRCYDSIEDRVADIRTRGVFHVTHLIRAQP